MATIVFERLVGRNVSRFISGELDLSGMKMSVNDFLQIAIVGWVFIIIVGSLVAYGFLHFEAALAVLAGMMLSVFYEGALYSYLELKIEGRKDFVETILPDYLQLTAANMRSGVSLSRAMILAVKPEFKYFGDDINIFGRQIYSGDTMANAFRQLANKYRSTTLKRTVRVIIEAEQYGGGLADLLNQIGKDLRNQQIVQKEVSGQLFMYTIFIAFAALIGAPALYGLTNQMIVVTTKVWSQIGGGGGALNTAGAAGASFIKLSKPQISPGAYYIFSLVDIFIITGFGAFIVSTISTGSTIKGVRYLPVFIIIGLIVFFVVSGVMSGLFASLGGGA